MKNKFGQTQSAYTLLADAYERVLLRMRGKHALSTGALLAAMMAAAWVAPGAGATAYTWTGGTSAWDTSDLNWGGTGTNAIWNATNGPNNEADFTGANTTVTTAANPTVNKIVFSANGYNIGGTGLTLAGAAPVIAVGSGLTATISAPLAGSAGFTKNGTGTLTLTANTANTISGVIMVNQGILNFEGSNLTSNITSGTNVVTFAGRGEVDLATMNPSPLSGNTPHAKFGSSFTGQIKILSSAVAAILGNQPTSAFAYNLGDLDVASGGIFYVNAATNLQLDALTGSSGSAVRSNNTDSNFATLEQFHK